MEKTQSHIQIDKSVLAGVHLFEKVCTMKEKRDETIILRLSKTEKNRIYEKMFSMGIRS